jgi:hypothetical protein
MSLKQQQALVEQILSKTVHENDRYREGKEAGIYLNGKLAGQHYPNGPARSYILAEISACDAHIRRYTKGQTNQEANYHRLLVENDWIDQEVEEMLKGFQEECLREPLYDESGNPLHSPEVMAMGRLETSSQYLEIYKDLLEPHLKNRVILTGDYVWTFFFGETYTEYKKTQAKRFEKSDTKSGSSKTPAQLIKDQKAKLNAIKA